MDLTVGDILLCQEVPASDNTFGRRLATIRSPTCTHTTRIDKMAATARFSHRANGL